MNRLVAITIILALFIVVGVLGYKSLERMHQEKNPVETNEEAQALFIQESEWEYV